MSEINWKARLLIFPPVALGIAAVFVLPMFKSPPPKAPVEEKAVSVRVIKISESTVVPRAVGYGTTRPARTWDAVAEVSGPVVWVAPALKNGALVEAGEELLRIDPAAYKLAEKQIQAQLSGAQRQVTSLRDALALEQQKADLSEADFARKEKLVRSGTVSQVTLDEARKERLSSRASVTNLRNNLDVKLAEIAVLEVQLESTRRDLTNTALKAPFDVRLTEIRTGQAQYANKGQILFTADGIDAAEVEAQFPIGTLRPLVTKKGGRHEPGLSPGVASAQALITLRAGTREIQWPATVDRVAGHIDPQTQSTGVVVKVMDPYGKARPGQRPPLPRGTFVEVKLLGQAQSGKMVIPRDALRGKAVFIAGPDNRLEIRPVKPAMIQGGFAVIAEGLAPGDMVVVSKLPAPVTGMLLDSKMDRKTKQKTVAEAANEEAKPGKSGKGGGQ